MQKKGRRKERIRWKENTEDDDERVRQNKEDVSYIAPMAKEEARILQ